MGYFGRLGIIFMVTLLADRISPGILVEQEWYEFFWAFIVGGANAFIRTLIEAENWPLSWTLLLVLAFILNLLLYILVLAGALSWLGIEASSFGSALLAAIVLTAGSAVASHFNGFKAKLD